MYLGFVGNHIWGVRPLLDWLIMPETYKPLPPLPLATACVLHPRLVAASITCQGGILEGYTKEPLKVVSKLLPV